MTKETAPLAPQTAPPVAASATEVPTQPTIVGRADALIEQLNANPFAAGSDMIRELAVLVAELAAAVETVPAKDA